MTRRRKPTLDRTRAAVRDSLDEQRARLDAPPDMTDADPIDIASAESMDASDPPAFSATKTGGNRHPAADERR